MLNGSLVNSGIGKKKYYRCVVYFNPKLERKPITYKRINNLDRFFSFVQREFKQAYYFNIYNNDTREFIQRMWVREFELKKR